MNKLKIGIPRGLLYYRYINMWSKFFEELNIDIVVSDKTNKQILDEGIKKTIDESCLALKIFVGHVENLKNKCDYILITRLSSIKKNEKMCTNFMALYDLTFNLFDDIRILKFNVDIDNNQEEADAFFDIGRILKLNKIKVIKAYIRAKKYSEEIEKKRIIKQNLLLDGQNIKILLAGHPYNLYDEFIGTTISSYFEKKDINVIYSDIYNKDKLDYECNEISYSNYWTFNRELLGAITHYKDKIDGIILVTSFPCGPDSLTNELIIRSLDIPTIQVIVDELNNDTGMITRLESFIDVIKEKRNGGNFYE